ncbi:MAG: DUF3606 domain-containing protein [Sphingomonadales bacterium]|nr:MAG: DUF3606 domain-containing protein [Sphingomonadales bacterium]
MIDASISMQPRDTDRIDLGDDHDVRDWTLGLAVGEQELREAVDAVAPARSGFASIWG